MITWVDVVTIAPALGAVPVPAQDAILADTYIQLSVDTWGSKFDTGWKYLAAHVGTLYLLSPANFAGLIGKEKVGEVEREYNSPLKYMDWLDSTWYGNMYQRLVRGLLKARIPLAL